MWLAVLFSSLSALQLMKGARLISELVCHMGMLDCSPGSIVSYLAWSCFRQCTTASAMLGRASKRQRLATAAMFNPMMAHAAAWHPSLAGMMNPFAAHGMGAPMDEDSEPEIAVTAPTPGPAPIASSSAATPQVPPAGGVQTVAPSHPHPEGDSSPTPHPNVAEVAASHAVSRLTHNKMHLYEHGDRTDELIPRSVSSIRGMPKVPSKFVFNEHVTSVKKSV